MIAILSALIGFLSAAFPELISVFREKQDKQHEVKLLEMQMQHQREARTQQHQLRLEEIRLEADTSEQHALNARLMPIGVAWVDALAASVRPVVSYLFFTLYACVKIAQFHLLTKPTLPWQEALSTSQALVVLWGENDMALFTTIMAFWFGQRTIAKFRRGAL